MSVTELAEMPPEPVVQTQDSGISALVHAARGFQLAIEPNQLIHRLARAEGAADSQDLCRCARWIGLRARQATVSVERLSALSLPVLLDTTQGWLCLQDVDDAFVTVYQPHNDKIRRYPIEVFAQHWQGQTILLAENVEPQKRQPSAYHGFSPLSASMWANLEMSCWCRSCCN